MNFISVTCFISALLAICSASFILFANRNNTLHRLWFFFNISISAWMWGLGMTMITPDPGSALFFQKVLYVGTIFIPVFFLQLSYEMVGGYKKARAVFFVNLGIAAIFLFALFNTQTFIEAIGQRTNFDYFPVVTGWSYNIFLIWFAVAVIKGLIILWGGFHNSAINHVVRQQITFMFYGTLIGFSAGSLNFLLDYNVAILPIYNFLVPLYLVFVGYAIATKQLFGIRVILTEFLVETMGVLLLVLPFLMPSFELVMLTCAIFILFCFFGFYLIKATQRENYRMEEAEFAAMRERALRHEAEDLANDLRHLNQAKTQFLLSTQHHLRSPLTIIQGYLSMVSEGSYGQVPAPVKEKVDISLNTTQKLINLVNEMLDVAHFQMNKGSVAKQPTDILQLVVGIVDDLQKNAESKKIYLRLDKKSPSFPQVAVDSHGIREAIYNIVDNAIKYTQEGGVTVTMGQTKDKLRISVIDTGIGLSDHDRRNLFNRTFERGSRAKEVNATGKGIGLYLAGQMIINNNGTIHAESEGRGKGTTFMIELPAISATPATSVSAEPTPMPIPKPPRRK